MKKFLSIFVLLLYITASTGFVVSLHYCMDRVDAVELGAYTEGRCHKCGMVHNECCRVELKLVKLQTSHTAPAGYKTQLVSPVSIPVSLADATLFNAQYKGPEYLPVADSPDHPPIFLMNRVFRL